jgi:hypothetical protein
MFYICDFMGMHSYPLKEAKCLLKEADNSSSDEIK